MNDHSPPHLTSSNLCVAGEIKRDPEDFIVEEIPAYQPSGAGTHVYLWIEKRDISADYLANYLSKQLEISRNEIGVAGLKDRRAITRQWVSVPEIAEGRLKQVDRDDIKILEQSRHENKLKTGHLRGNRFEVLLRTTNLAHLPVAEQLVQQINLNGVPNYFGTQRFGINGSTLELGYELLSGQKSPAKIPFKKRKFLMRLALSSVQSQLFNQVLAQRIHSNHLEQILPGDVMQVRETGGLFVTEDVDVEQTRYKQKETVPTGPLFGPKMKRPELEADQLEQTILAASELGMSHFEKFKKLTSGARRQLLIWPDDLELEQVTEGIWFRFSLPSGCYATVVLNEFLKNDLIQKEE